MRGINRIFTAKSSKKQKMYLHEQIDWTNFRWNDEKIIHLLAEVRNHQGKLLGKMESLGFKLQQEAQLDTLTLDVLKSTEIEGEVLNPEQVRSSIAKRLGMEIGGAVESNRDVEGMVEMIMDATQNCFESLSIERLFSWHSSLFPTGRSGMRKIMVGNWRTDAKGNMQVVSGILGKEKVHFQALDAILVPKEMEKFIEWFNNSTENIDLVIKSAIAHLWFITIHPFEDGNGRIVRALTDLLLARSDKNNRRFYSMSAQIRVERKTYYEILEKTQKGNLDITDWLVWFLNCLLNALKSTDSILSKVATKAQFWQLHLTTSLNERQKLMLNKLLDGFEGKLNTSKWAKIAKCSSDTALRDIQDLIDKKILRKESAGGRSTHYELIPFDNR
jgi:Fic family protein